MKFRRRQRWLRRFALGFAFATALFAGKVSPAGAKYDEGGANGQIVTAGGWSGVVDADTGVPVSAGIDESLNADANQVIPYLSHGIVTQAQADASTVPSGDELAIRNAIADRLAREAGNPARSAESIHDPYLTNLFVRQGESVGGADRSAQLSQTDEITVIPYLSHGVLGEAVKSRQAPEPFTAGVTDFPKPEPAATRPDDKAARFTGLEQPRVINYLSHGMAIDGDVGARPDNRADRFTPADGVSPAQLEVSGSSTEWDSALTFGIGALMLALALGLGLGYLRRPRLAL